MIQADAERLASAHREPDEGPVLAVGDRAVARLDDGNVSIKSRPNFSVFSPGRAGAPGGTP